MQKRQFHAVPWTLRQTVLGMCCTLLPYLLFSWVSLLFNTSTTPKGNVSLQADLANAITIFILSLVIYSAFFLSAPLYLAAKTIVQNAERKRAILDALGFQRFNWRLTILWLFLLFLAILLLNTVYQWLLTHFHLPLQTNDQRVLEQGKHTPISLYATLLIAVLVAPFCEEVFFRSFIFMGFLRSMPLGTTLVVSSLIFAVAHNDIGSFTVLFFIGLALAFLRWRTDSIWPGILLHTLNNAAGALTIILALNGINIPGF